MNDVDKSLLRFLKNNDLQLNKANINDFTKKLFLFLQNNNCLDEYVDERKLYLSKIKYNNNYFFAPIASAFKWVDTKKGVDFWFLLHKQYVDD